MTNLITQLGTNLQKLASRVDENDIIDIHQQEQIDNRNRPLTEEELSQLFLGEGTESDAFDPLTQEELEKLFKKEEDGQ